MFTLDYALPQGPVTAFLSLRDTDGDAARLAAGFTEFLESNGFTADAAGRLARGLARLAGLGHDRGVVRPRTAARRHPRGGVARGGGRTRAAMGGRIRADGGPSAMNHEAPPPAPVPRRAFLRQTAIARAAAAGAGLAGWALHSAAPPPAEEEVELFQVGDYRVPGTEGRIAIARHAPREELIRTVFAALGGIETFIRPGDRVLIKVNAAFASPPAARRHDPSRAVAEVVRLCLDAGAAGASSPTTPSTIPTAASI